MEIKKTYDGGRFTGKYHVSHHTNVLLRILPGSGKGQWVVQTTTDGVPIIQECLSQAAQAAGLQEVKRAEDGHAVMACRVPRETVRSLVSDIIQQYDRLLSGKLSEFGGDLPQKRVPF